MHVRACVCARVRVGVRVCVRVRVRVCVCACVRVRWEQRPRRPRGGARTQAVILLHLLRPEVAQREPIVVVVPEAAFVSGTVCTLACVRVRYVRA